MSTVYWEGASGKTYQYILRPLHTSPPSGKGNYIFAKKVQDSFDAVYVGQGDLPERYDAAMDEGCVQKRGATHYCYHTRNANSRTDRQDEELDIIKGHPECKAPNGCNGQGP